MLNFQGALAKMSKETMSPILFCLVHLYPGQLNRGAMTDTR